jgi:hypothetical protein
MSSAYAVYKALEEYKLDGLIERIRCPVLICDPDNEQFWPGQSRRMYDALQARRRSCGSPPRRARIGIVSRARRASAISGSSTGSMTRSAETARRIDRQRRPAKPAIFARVLAFRCRADGYVQLTAAG